MPTMTEVDDVQEKTSVGGTQSIVVTDRELYLIRAALQSYLNNFSHTEGEIVEETKDLLEKLPKTSDPSQNVNRVFPDRTDRLTL